LVYSLLSFLSSTTSTSASLWGIALAYVLRKVLQAMKRPPDRQEFYNDQVSTFFQKFSKHAIEQTDTINIIDEKLDNGTNMTESTVILGNPKTTGMRNKATVTSG